MPSSGAGGSSFPKWQIALALGATSAIGLGYWYLRQQSKPVKKTTLTDLKGTSTSLDDSTQDVQTEQAETPFQQAQRYKAEGNNYFRKGKFDEAINMYNKAIETCPPEHTHDLAIYYQNRAAAYEPLKKWSSVIADCTKALEQNPKYEKALYRRANAYEIMKDLENCLDDITAVCILQNFNNQNALLMADRVLTALGKQHSAEAMKNRKPKLPSPHFINTYFISFSEDPVHNSLKNMEQPIGENVKGFLKAKLAFRNEHFDEIIPACTEEINSSESESNYIFEALSLRASFYLLSGAYKEALDDFKTIIDAPDADVKIKVNCLIKRASLHMQLENSDEYSKDFEKAVELGPEISDVFHHRGQVNLITDKTEEARNDFNKAVTLNPNFVIALIQKYYIDYRYAASMDDKYTMEKIIDDFKKATKQYSDCSEVFVLFAQILTERHEYKEADKMFLKAFEVEPNNATILVHRGLLLLRWKGETDEAVKLMQSAIKLDEKCQFAYDTLGTIEVQRGNLLIAIDLFDKAIGLARTENEMTHLFSLKDAVVSQLKISTKLGIEPQFLKSGI